MNSAHRSVPNQLDRLNPLAAPEWRLEEASPALMLSGIGSTALAMASFVWWNASSESTPSLTAQLIAGTVAALTLALGHFIFFQRWNRYAPSQRARPRSRGVVRSEPRTPRAPIGQPARHPRTIAANSRFRHAPTATRQRRRRTMAHAS
jgi:hypothetical protein